MVSKFGISSSQKPPPPYFQVGISKNSGTPKMDGLQWKTLLKWMIWGYHHLRKHPGETMFLGVWSSTTLRTWKIQVELPGEAVTNHDELMSNFFAQPGGTLQEIEHWEFGKCVATSRWWFHFVNIHPYFGEDFQFDLYYYSNGLKPPTR